MEEDKNVESIRLIKKERLNLNMFAIVDGHSADLISRAKPTDLLILKIAFWKSKNSYGLQITKADIFDREVFESVLSGYW